MSPLGFKATVSSLICTWQRYKCYMFPEIHIWCDTSRPLWWPAWQPSCSLPCTCEQTLGGGGECSKPGDIMPPFTVWYQADALLTELWQLNFLQIFFVWGKWYEQQKNVKSVPGTKIRFMYNSSCTKPSISVVSFYWKSDYMAIRYTLMSSWNIFTIPSIVPVPGFNSGELTGKKLKRKKNISVNYALHTSH